MVPALAGEVTPGKPMQLCTDQRYDAVHGHRVAFSPASQQSRDFACLPHPSSGQRVAYWAFIIAKNIFEAVVSRAGKCRFQ
jgi:hypothetical protein